MKLPLISILLIYSIIFNFSCKKANPDEDLNSALTRLVLQANYVTITGTARGPGVLKNAQVDIIPLPSDGSCVNS
ncbi:MAG: hypothetical protein KDK36_18155, partial [Leptospiraceae bacterium]|nr:hypothetical protein [Leptospiraceae bacterium]